MSPRLPIAVIATLAILACSAANAAANNRFTLDAAATSPGNVIVDAAGTAYIAWGHLGGGTTPDTPRFCKIPRGGTCPTPMALAIPGATTLSDGISGAFPVFGAGATMYIVAPRYALNDVVLYTSANSGASFDAGTIITGTFPLSAYSSKTNPTNVIRTAGGNFHIGAYNAGLGFSTFPTGQGAFSFANPGVAASPAPRSASTRAPTRSRSTGTSAPSPTRCCSTATTAPGRSRARPTGPVRRRSRTATSRRWRAARAACCSSRRTTRRPQAPTRRSSTCASTPARRSARP